MDVDFVHEVSYIPPVSAAIYVRRGHGHGRQWMWTPRGHGRPADADAPWTQTPRGRGRPVDLDVPVNVGAL